jgi:hypothetical protein
MPKDAMFRGVDLATFRSAWRDPKATFVAFKGGSNKAHHGHFDLGTFVLDALGERWAIDLGSDDYGSPGYFGAERPTYYRCSTAGHNTIAFEGRNEEEDATAPLTAFFATKARAHAVIDLTNSYRNSARAERILRGIALLNRRDVLVQDEIHLERPQRVNWSMHTRAKVTVSGRTATLQQNGQTLTARLLYPPGVSFEATPAPNPPKQSYTEGVTVLSINFRVDEPTHIAVLFSPGAGEADIPKLNPVSTWADSAGLGSKGQPHNEPSRTDRDIYAPPPPISFPRPPSRHK